jgi:hypothetical protein
MAPLRRPATSDPRSLSQAKRTSKLVLAKSVDLAVNYPCHLILPTHPHFVRVSALRASSGFDQTRICFHSETSNLQPYSQCVAETVE